MISPSRISYSTLPMPWMPVSSRRIPSSGSSRISASAIKQLVVGSHPGNAIPAALRIRLRPPTIGQLDIDAGVVLREARHLPFAVDRDRQLVDPAGQDLLDPGLPQPEAVVVAGRKVADVQPDA